MDEDTPIIDAIVEWVPGYSVLPSGLSFDGRRHEMVPAEHVRPLERALRAIVEDHDAYCERYVGVSQHSHDLARIAERALTECTPKSG